MGTLVIAAKSFWADDSGQGLVEYALIIAFVAVGLISSCSFSGTASATCSITRPSG
jgi:Flp pilus assembly pilin Flp